MALATDGLQEVRDRILDVARRHFATYGYRRSGVADIAREAGVAAGTVYRYFRNKEDLLRQAVEHSTMRWLERARQALAGPGTALERLARQGEASVEHNHETRLLNAVLNRDSDIIFPPLLDELHEMLLRKNVAMMADVIRDGIAEGSIRDVDPERAAFILYVSGNTLFNQTAFPYAEILPLFGEITRIGLVRRDGAPEEE